MGGNHCEQIPRLYAVGWENHDDELGYTSCDKTADESPAPDMNRGVRRRPAASVVAQADFERKVDEDCKSHVFLTESFVEKFQVCDAIIGLEANFGDEVDHDNALYVSEFKDAKHAFVNFEDAIPLLGLVFLLENGETDSNEQIAPAPECEIAAEGHYSFSTGSRAEPAIGEVRGVEGEEDSVGKKVAGSETDSLRGGSVREILWGQ